MNQGHGHVFPRDDGVRARCGGPSICPECAKDMARAQAAWDKHVDVHTLPDGTVDIEAMNATAAENRRRLVTTGLDAEGRK